MKIVAHDFYSATQGRTTYYLRLVHPALLLAISLITAATAFLSGEEYRVLFASQAVLIKLMAGTALLFVVGIYFTQQIASRRTYAEMRAMIIHNRNDLGAMTQALHKDIVREKVAAE